MRAHAQIRANPSTACRHASRRGARPGTGEPSLSIPAREEAVLRGMLFGRRHQHGRRCARGCRCHEGGSTRGCRGPASPVAAKQRYRTLPVVHTVRRRMVLARTRLASAAAYGCPAAVKDNITLHEIGHSTRQPIMPRSIEAAPAQSLVQVGSTCMTCGRAAQPLIP